MKTNDFYYDLPEELIAQTPSAVRSESRLLVADRRSGKLYDRKFSDVIEYLNPGDVLVRNTTRVIPARLIAKRADTGGTMEFLLLHRLAGNEWEALARPAKRAKAGHVYSVTPELSVRVLGETNAEGGRRVELCYSGVLEEVLDRAGTVPLPPYIRQRLDDPERYQTVYSHEPGSAAAPTAGLHFTNELLDAIQKKGVTVADVLLHVGLGTFRPVSAENVEDHVMHSEYYLVTDEAAEKINAARLAGGRIVSVGTTSTRTLESVTDDAGTVHAGSGYTNIFITPGYRFKAVDAQITNFHLPESTLLMLVSALMTRESALSAYEHAVKERYRFFSFGDAMLIL